MLIWNADTLRSDSMRVTRTEVDAVPVSTPDPGPVFRDGNLTIYGIPLTSAKSSPAFDQDQDGVNVFEAADDTGKRKRAISPDPSTKRPRVEDLLGKGSDSSPTLLQDVEADEWRRKAVDAMFPFTSLSTQATASAESRKGSKHDQNKDVGPSKDTVVAPFDDTVEVSEQPPRKFIYSPGLPHRNKRLPRFIRNEDKETLCYVCVGPRVRGKFDAKKAISLQIPKGPLRGKLAKGETITFMVDDGKGGQEERTVRPEECVGPSEAPMVRPCTLNNSNISSNYGPIGRYHPRCAFSCSCCRIDLGLRAFTALSADAISGGRSVRGIDDLSPLR